ncbi:MAG: hypothetical protein K0S42_3435, partial [Microvirga sp.]|nr:hypothetical protein [Microvirga sp.]
RVELAERNPGRLNPPPWGRNNAEITLFR